MRTGRTGRVFFIITCGWAALALASRLPHLEALSPVGAAMAQDTHDEGGHTGGEGGHTGGEGGHTGGEGGHTGGEGGHTGGEGGHSGGSGGHSEDLAAVAEESAHGSPIPLKPLGTFRDPDYFRFELGLSAPSARDAYWQSPGGARANFALDMGHVGYGSLALGHYWGDGVRGEVALSAFGMSDFSTTSTTTVPPSGGTHASMTGKTSSIVVMANGYYTPYIKALGRVQPYVSAGLGLSSNTMGTWTRTNATVSTPVRSFEGATSLALAASVGVGVSMYMGEVAGKPTSVDLGYRYYDLGNVTGSSTPLPGSGKSTPVKPLNFNKTDQVVSLSVRVWF